MAQALACLQRVAVQHVVLVCIPPLPQQRLWLHARAAKRALPMQPRTPSAQQVPLSTVQRVPAMVATMVMATAAAPARQIRGVWVKSRLPVLNFLPPQL